MARRISPRPPKKLRKRYTSTSFWQDHRREVIEFIIEVHKQSPTMSRDELAAECSRWFSGTYAHYSMMSPKKFNEAFTRIGGRHIGKNNKVWGFADELETGLPEYLRAREYEAGAPAPVAVAQRDEASLLDRLCSSLDNLTLAINRRTDEMEASSFELREVAGSLQTLLEERPPHRPTPS